jgi:hypothetical protein
MKFTARRLYPHSHVGLLDLNLCLHFYTRLVIRSSLLLSEHIFSLTTPNLVVDLYLALLIGSKNFVHQHVSLHQEIKILILYTTLIYR